MYRKRSLRLTNVHTQYESGTRVYGTQSMYSIMKGGCRKKRGICVSYSSDVKRVSSQPPSKPCVRNRLEMDTGKREVDRSKEVNAEGYGVWGGRGGRNGREAPRALSKKMEANAHGRRGCDGDAPMSTNRADLIFIHRWRGRGAGWLATSGGGKGDQDPVSFHTLLPAPYPARGGTPALGRCLEM